MTSQNQNTSSSDIKLDDLTNTKDDGTIEYNTEYKWKLFTTRLDYAWKYFDFHAKQRTTMFNFFLIFTGLIVNGYVQLVKEKSFILAIIIALSGVIITIAFVALERRNEELVHIAEDILKSLEEDILFTGYIRHVRYPNRRDWWGKMKWSIEENELGIIMRQSKDTRQSVYSHGIWLPQIYYLIVVAFGVLLVYSIYKYLQLHGYEPIYCI